METKQVVVCMLCKEPIVPDENGYAACDSVWDDAMGLYMACHNECNEKRVAEAGEFHVRGFYASGYIGPHPTDSIDDGPDSHWLRGPDGRVTVIE